MNNTLFNLMFTIVPILFACIFIFTFAMIFSPKLRGKMMSRQLKTLKYIADDLTDVTTTMGNASIKAQKNILDQNEDTLRDISTRNANITKDGIETTARAIRKGLTEDSIYCKHCGSSIDADSKFCKTCGKEQ